MSRIGTALRIAWWAGVPFVLHMPRWAIGFHFSLLVASRSCEAPAEREAVS